VQHNLYNGVGVSLRQGKNAHADGMTIKGDYMLLYERWLYGMIAIVFTRVTLYWLPSSRDKSWSFQQMICQQAYN
jgi:hypothetical protein